MKPSHQGVSASKRRGRRLWVTGATLFIALIILSLSLFTVRTGEHAVVTQFGAPIRAVSAPGIYVKYPYQTIRVFEARTIAHFPPASEFLTVEKNAVTAASAVYWRISDPIRFLQTVRDRAGAQSRLNDIVYAALGAALGRNTLHSFVSANGSVSASAILAEVASASRAVASRDFGIEILDVTLLSFDFPKQNRARLFARMRSERGRMAMRYRSEGEEEGLKLRAAADEERGRIVAEAIVAAQRRRAEGERDAARIYAEALGTSPDFYRFLRTLEASGKLVRKDMTMMLPADSDLFGLLLDSRRFEREAPARHREE